MRKKLPRERERERERAYFTLYYYVIFTNNVQVSRPVNVFQQVMNFSSTIIESLF